jgi:hypothetical protein
VTRGVGGLLLGGALLALLAAAPPPVAPAPPVVALGWVLPRTEVVARAERRLSPSERGLVVAKLTTWAALQPVVVGRRGSHGAALAADPDRWLWALRIGAPAGPGAGVVVAADAATGEWLGDFGPVGDAKGLPARLRAEQRAARARWDALPDRAEAGG